MVVLVPECILRIEWSERGAAQPLQVPRLFVGLLIREGKWVNNDQPSDAREVAAVPCHQRDAEIQSGRGDHRVAELDPGLASASRLRRPSAPRVSASSVRISSELRRAAGVSARTTTGNPLVESGACATQVRRLSCRIA